jgi:anti-anti-sigma regulatory factor
MGISLDKSDAGAVIALADSIDITCAAELKALLLEALSSGTEVLISLDDATDLDVTAFQLLWAAERQARQSGVEFRISGQVPEPVSIALAEAGFQAFSTLVHAG